MSRRFVYFQGTPPSLPFYVLIAVDSSGSLTPMDVPEVYDAFDAIFAAYNSNPLFEGITAEQFIKIIPPNPSEPPEDERLTNESFMQWFNEFPLEYKPIGSQSRCVMFTVLNEVWPVYYINNGPPFVPVNFYQVDYDAFAEGWPDNGLIKGKIIEVDASPGQFGSEDSDSVYFTEFLDGILSDPNSLDWEGTPKEALNTAFISEYSDLPLISRTNVGFPPAYADEGDPILTISGVYNAIVSEINLVLIAEGFDTLPYPYA
jgi:hypothetical protein